MKNILLISFIINNSHTINIENYFITILIIKIKKRKLNNRLKAVKTK
jgi:hypothetical protein